MEHIPDEQLEAVVMGTLPSEDSPKVDQHLRACCTCQERLRETAAYVAAMQGAARQLRDSQRS